MEHVVARTTTTTTILLLVVTTITIVFVICSCCSSSEITTSTTTIMTAPTTTSSDVVSLRRKDGDKAVTKLMTMAVVSNGGDGDANHRQQDDETTSTVSTAEAAAAVETLVNVKFYGESQCPYCRKFVREAWPEIWNDKELRSVIEYDFIPWGNAYFATNECGKGPTYDAEERQCWYKKCIAKNSSITINNKNNNNDGVEGRDNDCFIGPVIYQHSTEEGILDIYETCVKELYGLDIAVNFTYCVEGPKMDDTDTYGTAKELMSSCIDACEDIHACYKLRGHLIEISNAKLTPNHPGVPYILVDGDAIDNPFDIKNVICDKLKQKQIIHTQQQQQQKKGNYQYSPTTTTNFQLPATCDDTK